MLNEQTKKNKGSISLPIAAVAGIILSTISGAAAYFGTVKAQADKTNEVKFELVQETNQIKTDLSKDIADTNKDVAVEKTRNDQFEKRLDRFENKIDALLQVNGVNPNKIQ